MVVAAGDTEAYRKASGPHAEQVTFIEQANPVRLRRCDFARPSDFIGGDPFLLMVSDHLYLSHTDRSCVSQLLKTAETNSCSMSAVQATHESKLPLYGAIGGVKVPQAAGLYEIRNVIEKPSPTLAEQHLTIPGLRAAQYLCFFGMHALSPKFIEISLNDGSRRMAFRLSLAKTGENGTLPRLTRSRAGVSTLMSRTAS